MKLAIEIIKQEIAQRELANNHRNHLRKAECTAELESLNKALSVLKAMPEEKEEERPIQIGTLNRIVGMVGYEETEICHPVFEFQERYIIYLKSTKDGTETPFRYYKETLKPLINFLKK